MDVSQHQTQNQNKQPLKKHDYKTSELVGFVLGLFIFIVLCILIFQYLQKSSANISLSLLLGGVIATGVGCVYTTLARVEGGLEAFLTGWTLGFMSPPLLVLSIITNHHHYY
jgi:hypothetical protein